MRVPPACLANPGPSCKNRAWRARRAATIFLTDAGTTPPAARLAPRCPSAVRGTTRKTGCPCRSAHGARDGFPLSATPKLRSLPDRLRQIALFEIGGLVLVTPPFAWASGVSLADSIGLLALLALIASIWNGCYNTAFDWLEGRLTGRTADRRPLRLRVVHALGFESGLLLMTLPIIVAWTGMSWVDALLADIALAITYTVYAFVFNLGYDRLFPIAPGVERLPAMPAER